MKFLFWNAINSPLKKKKESANCKAPKVEKLYKKGVAGSGGKHRCFDLLSCLPPYLCIIAYTLKAKNGGCGQRGAELGRFEFNFPLICYHPFWFWTNCDIFLRIPYAVACQHLVASWRGSSESLAVVSEKCLVHPITFWRSAQTGAKHSLSRLQVSRKRFILVMD